ncbi:MAG: hypothetical protein ABSC88_03495 [Terracidiphilus sp.]
MKVWTFTGAAILMFLAGCGGASQPPSLTLSVSSAAILVYSGQTSVTVNASLVRQGSTGVVTLSVQGLPNGASVVIQSPGSSNTGSLTFSAGTSSAASYSLTVNASDGTTSGSTTLTLTVGAVVQISNTKTARFSEFMSDTLLPADWDVDFFTQNPTATQILGNLLPQHIRLQEALHGIPQESASSWDFTTLDTTMQPVLTIGDQSPEFQVRGAPAFMYVNGDNTQSFADPTFQQFAAYSQNLVKYYNAGGFTSSDGVFHVSPSYPTQKITWWGIYNEPDVNNNLTPQQYVQMYNTVVPAMQAADPSLKFVAMELAYQWWPPDTQAWVQPFVSGVTARVDVMATHYYSVWDPTYTDAQVFSTVPGFASDVQTIYADMAANPALASVPVWVTENNVDCDLVEAPDGTVLDTDPRGSSAFFAAWRPYVFSQLGKAGAQALYHFTFNANPQYGEVDQNNASLFWLSYWVDYWLARNFPSPPGADLLAYTSTDTSDIEILPVQNPDSSVTVMVVNYAVNGQSDVNGPGAPRTVLVDTSAFGNFSTATLLVIDGNTDVTKGPSASSISAAPQISIVLNGYGTAFLRLQ